MRDFIQNFYDAIEHDEFYQAFQYKYLDGILTMKAKTSFSLKWLYFIGASNKKQNGKYAGKFGEGFKMAALVAHRDYEWKVSMESADWKINVGKVTSTIAGKEMDFLAYEEQKREKDEYSILTLEGVSEENYRCFENALYDFEFRGNPNFGECLWKKANMAIYRSNEKCGKVFAAYQCRGTLTIPYIFSNRNYVCDHDDRDRRTFYDYEKVRFVKSVVLEISNAEVAYELLCALKIYWSKTNIEPSKQWVSIICSLIDKVSQDELVQKRFYDTYGNYYISKDIPYGFPNLSKKIMLEWYRQSEYYKKTTVVDAYFSKLGLKSMYSLCVENNGFQIYRELNQLEKRLLVVLKGTANDVIGELLMYDNFPPCQIIINQEAPMEGLSRGIKQQVNKKNLYGIKVEMCVKVIYLKAELFQRDKFGEAISVYMHELLHQYGGDSSLSFHKMLYHMNEKVLSNLDIVKKYEEKWRAIFDDTIRDCNRLSDSLVV